MSPVFSVVIPTYNQADLLRTALASVLNQTFTDFDVWVVNNYSTDHTVEVANSFGDSRINVIDFSNQGIIGAGRNVGIKASKGELVAFLDSDDSWHPGKLQAVSTAISNNPEADVFCHAQMVFRDGNPVEKTEFGTPNGYDGSLFDYWLRHGNRLTPSAAVVSRRCLESAEGFSEDPTLVTVEDSDLWLRLSKTCEFVFIPEVLGDYNLHPGSSSANVETHLKAALALIDRHWAGYEPEGKLSSRSMALRHQQANVHFGAARQYQRAGSFKKPLVHFTKALMLYPLHLRSIAGLGLLLAGRPLGAKRSARIVDALWRVGRGFEAD
jgi:glycosyltransferase involved in cell wall biosynthesis